MKPTRRLSWRDPNMPVIRQYTFRNRPPPTEPFEVDPEFERQFREHLMKNTTEPHFTVDPTYNLRRKP